jgi:hypothetical protein
MLGANQDIDCWYRMEANIVSPFVQEREVTDLFPISTAILPKRRPRALWYGSWIQSLATTCGADVWCRRNNFANQGGAKQYVQSLQVAVVVGVACLFGHVGGTRS